MNDHTDSRVPPRADCAENKTADACGGKRSPSGHGSKFERKKEEAIAALLKHRTLEEAARAVDLSVTTLIRWMKDPRFEAEYREARLSKFRESLARVEQAANVAVTVVLKILLDPNTSDSCRLEAATTIWSFALKSVELEDVLVKLSHLEQIVRSVLAGGMMPGPMRVESQTGDQKHTATPTKLASHEPDAVTDNAQQSKVDPKKEEAIAALLTHRNIEEAAQAIGVSPATLRLWQKDPVFEAAYREARLANFRQSTTRLQQAAGSAVTVVLKIMIDPDVSNPCRLRAARTSYTFALQAIELEDVFGKLSQLEQQMAAFPGGILQSERNRHHEIYPAAA